MNCASRISLTATGEITVSAGKHQCFRINCGRKAQLLRIPQKSVIFPQFLRKDLKFLRKPHPQPCCRLSTNSSKSRKEPENLDFYKKRVAGAVRLAEETM